ncbi:uncharacterized protein LOC131997164 [Stomoxys calcitrans]|uniref:uncharacterized protein LOC131997164 n=1 Tax=Stomoxys calcitrans TaxID=35570 RepID=UPI0027E28564|nr:uncharacterized protein LOC131997164 [Stomoxys calcitrans]
MEIRNFITTRQWNRGSGVNGLKNSKKTTTEDQMWAAGGLLRDVRLPRFSKIIKEIADGIRAGGGLMREVCLSKLPKRTNEIADGIGTGSLSNDKDAKCHVYYFGNDANDKKT